ncbi:MAG: S-layer homology domain-containing protein [Oscillospiraceae bacterium]|nr:S-layer homology domain-containing protein [Oscillospiraceae bacterium]
MIKKICSAILSLSIAVSALATISVSAYSDVTTSGQKSAVELVSGLNIMSPDSNEEFGSSTIVKRGEFALYAARLMGYNVTPGSLANGTFDDVDISTEEGTAVELLAGIGAIDASAKQFNPNEGITYNAAIKIILSCAGYDTAAQNSGGYPNGYIKVAAENDLSKNLSKSGGEALTKTEAAILLYNALFIYPMELNNRTYEKSSETLLQKVYDVYELTGVVTGYEKSSLLNRQLGDGQVQIGDTVYECSAPGIKNYIGYNIKAYYADVRGEGRKIVAFTEKAGQNKTTTVDADDIDQVTNTSVRYYPNNSLATKTVKVSADATIIYNGRYRTNSGDLSSILSDVVDGDVTFIANDGSDTAKVIIINSYKHLLIERTDKRNYRLYLQNGSGSSKATTDPAYLPDVITTDPDDIDVAVYIGDEEVSFDNIQAGDAITMKESADKQSVELYISRNVVSGTIGTISDEEININSTVYDISPFRDKVYRSGDAGTFAITTNGKFLGMVSVAGAQRNYAYVIKSYTDDPEERAYLKLYTTSGEVVKYTCADNVRLNNSKRNYREIAQMVSAGELITYTLNSAGELATINRPYDASSKYITADSEGNLRLYVNDTEFVKDWNKSSVRYVDGIMGMTFITEDTVIFAMPRFDDGDESEYRLLTKADLTNRTYSDVTAFDIDRQGRAGAIVIVEDVSDSVSMSLPLFFISKVNDAVTDDNEQVRRITGFEKGQEITLDFDDDSKSVTYEDGWMNYSGNESFDTGYRDLQKGDAIQYILGNDGRVTAYRLVYNNKQTAFDKKGRFIENNVANYYEDWSATGAVTKLDFSDNLYIAYGDVQMRYMDYMIILGLPESDRLKYASSKSPVSIMDYYRPMNLLDNAYIYVYDVSANKGAGSVEIGDMEDIQKGDVCFVRSKKMGELNEIMVYHR